MFNTLEFFNRMMQFIMWYITSFKMCTTTHLTHLTILIIRTFLLILFRTLVLLPIQVYTRTLSDKQSRYFRI